MKHSNQPGINISRFRRSDSEACFNLRRRAFLEVFSQELDPEALERGAYAYDTDRFGRIIGTLDTFVAYDGSEVVGFCTIRPEGGDTAEILYLYVQLERAKQGIGSSLVRRGEQWLRQEKPNITTIVLDTAVPKYNLGFWKHLGYKEIGPSRCSYPGGTIPAVRLSKKTAPNSPKSPDNKNSL